MSGWNLTVGAIEGILADDSDAFDRPVLQVLGRKLVGTRPDRYRLVLSDGRHMHSAAILAAQLSGLVTSDRLDTNAVIRLDRYICIAVQPGNRRIVILLELTVLGTGSEVGVKIGNPQTLNPSAAGDLNVTSTTANVTTNNFDNMKEEIDSYFSCTARQLDSNSTNESILSVTKEITSQSSKAKETPTKVYPIAYLTPYQNRWTIKARVTHKSSIRTWTNFRGEGTIFDMTLLDKSGEIRATVFKNDVDKFYSLIEVNKVYYIRKADLKIANKDYSTTNNDYDMAFTGETEVIPCDDGDDLPTNTFNFVAINQLESRKANDNIDVIGIVKEVDDVKMVVARRIGKELKKRDITLVDDSEVQVRLTLWENDAETFDGNGNPVLAVKRCRVSNWGGRSLTACKTSQIILNPDIQESHHLRRWFDSVGRSIDYVQYKSEGGFETGNSGGGTNWKNFAEIKAQNLGFDKAECFTIKATFVFLNKENCLYHACPQQDCNKKLIDQENRNYYCEKCKKNYPNFKWGIGLRAILADFSDNQWITCFQDTAEAILGKSADELAHLKDVDDGMFGHVFSEVAFKSFIFRLRSKMETFNNESRLKTTCMQTTAINYVDYNRKLIADIEALLGPV